MKDSDCHQMLMRDITEEQVISSPDFVEVREILDLTYITQVLPNVFVEELGYDPSSLQFRLRSHTRAHQYLRRIDGTSS